MKRANLFLNKMVSENVAALYMVIAGVLWSTNGLFVKYIPWSGMCVSFMRSGFCVLFTLVYIKFNVKRLILSLETFVGGAVIFACGFLFIFATKLTTAANAAVLTYTCPIFIILFMTIFYKQRYGASDYAVVLLTFAGIALMFFGELDGGHLLGNLLALLGGAITSWQYILFSKGKNQDKTISSILIAHTATALVALPFFWIDGPQAGQVTAPIILAGAALGVFSLGLPNMFYSIAVICCPPLKASLISMIDPILNPIWVFLLIGERPSPLALSGAAVVIAVITLWSVRNARHSVRTEELETRN